MNPGILVQSLSDGDGAIDQPQPLHDFVGLAFKELETVIGEGALKGSEAAALDDVPVDVETFAQDDILQIEKEIVESLGLRSPCGSGRHGFVDLRPCLGHSVAEIVVHASSRHGGFGVFAGSEGPSEVCLASENSGLRQMVIDLASQGGDRFSGPTFHLEPRAAAAEGDYQHRARQGQGQLPSLALGLGPHSRLRGLDHRTLHPLLLRGGSGAQLLQQRLGAARTWPPRR